MKLIHGDCLEKIKELEDNSIDSIVTDPPYGLSFMGKKWDYDVPSIDIWKECLRVLKPGGHLLSFAGTRTQHRMSCNIEDAGFEIRDMISWVYGSGFPKSLNISKAIDKEAGAEREVVGIAKGMGKQNPEWNGLAQGRTENSFKPEYKLTTPSTDLAKYYEGWGTALKPACEPITVARKPLSESTVAKNTIKYGTGGINIDGCRIHIDEATGRPLREVASLREDISYNGNSLAGRLDGSLKSSKAIGTTTLGRWPANFIHDGSNEVLELFPITSTESILPHNKTHESENLSMSGKNYERGPRFSSASSGSASRFFYCAKSSKEDRNEGCELLEEKQSSGLPMRSKEGDKLGKGIDGSKTDRLTTSQNNHPTVKPIDLMKYLVRLVTPKNGICLDPFMGSGSTGKACVLEGFDFIGIELDKEYIDIATSRINHAQESLKTVFDLM